MSLNDKENYLPKDDEEEGGTTGTGGQTGEIHFRYHDVLSDKPRDDNLPPAEQAKFVALHEAKHKILVIEQRDEIKAREAAKEGKKLFNNANNYGLGNGGGGASNFKTHWLSNTRQFGVGRDNKVANLPTQDEANTNDKQKKELDHKLNYRPGQRPAPRLER